MLFCVLMFFHVFVLQAAHRTYLNVRKTIKPDMNLMARLFLNESLTWPEFRRSVLGGHKNRMGQVTLRQPTQSIYTYPAPDCMCTARRSIAEIKDWTTAATSEVVVPIYLVKRIRMDPLHEEQLQIVDAWWPLVIEASVVTAWTYLLYVRWMAVFRPTFCIQMAAGQMWVTILTSAETTVVWKSRELLVLLTYYLLGRQQICEMHHSEMSM